MFYQMDINRPQIAKSHYFDVYPGGRLARAVCGTGGEGYNGEYDMRELEENYDKPICLACERMREKYGFTVGVYINKGDGSETYN